MKFSKLVLCMFMVMIINAGTLFAGGGSQGGPAAGGAAAAKITVTFAGTEAAKAG